MPQTYNEAAMKQAKSLLASGAPSVIESAVLIGLEATHPGIAVEAAAALDAPAAGDDGPRAVDQQTLVTREIEQRYGIEPGAVQRPSTIKQLLDLLNLATEEGVSLRPVGSARSLSDAPGPTDDTMMVSTAGFSDSLPVPTNLLKDPSIAGNLYRSGAGRTVAQVFDELDPKPRDPKRAPAKGLGNLGAGKFQTLVGALSTSTHGSGITKPGFANMVRALEIATFDDAGNAVARQLEPTNGISDKAKFDAAQAGAAIPVELVQDDDEFYTALVSIGCVGVIYAVWLEVRDGYFLEEKRIPDWWSDVKGRLLSYHLKKNEWFEMVLAPLPSKREDTGEWDWRMLRSERNEVPAWEPSPGRPPLMTLGSWKVGRLASGVVIASALSNPITAVPRNLKTGVMATKVERNVGKYYNVLQLNLDLNSASTEVNVPLAKAVDAIDALLKLFSKNFDKMKKRLGKNPKQEKLQRAWKTVPIPTAPLGIRFVPMNGAYLSPMSDRDTCTIEVPMPGSDFLDGRVRAAHGKPPPEVALYNAYLLGRAQLFRQIKREMKPFNGRPHWGQANDETKAEVQEIWPKFKLWRSVYRKRNRDGIFNGAITDRLSISVHNTHETAPNKLPDAVDGTCIFRHAQFEDRAFLRLHGDVAWKIYTALQRPIRPRRTLPFLPRKQKRMGVSLIATTQNIRHPVIVEFRISPLGVLLSQPDQWKLFATLRQAFRGDVSFDGQRLTIGGKAARGIRDFVGKGRAVESLPVPKLDGSVVLTLQDMATGEWRMDDLL